MTPEQITHIILHHAAMPDHVSLQWDDIKAFHTRVRKWTDIGYHVVIENVEGTYIPILARPWNQSGAHAPGYNSTSLGVCLVGNFETGPIPIAQYRCAITTVRWLCQFLQIPYRNVLGHRETKATACPGKHIDMDEFRTNLAS